MIPTDRFVKVEVSSRDELRAWLLENHHRAEGVWLVTQKKSSGPGWFPHQDVVDELLCFGWIDGVARKLDDRRTMQLITPRRTQQWARSYKRRIDVLETEGRMHQSGRVAVQDARDAGLWEAMNDVDNLVIPDDLAAALASRPGATDNFLGIPPSSRRFALRWIKAAKADTTRQRRVTTTADLAQQGKRVPGS